MNSTEDRAARIAAIRARLADTTAEPYSMYDFGPLGCAVGDAYFFGESRSDVAWLISQYERADRDRRALYPFVKWAQGAGEVDVDGVCCWCQRTDCTTATHSTCFGWEARKLLQGWEGRKGAQP